MADRSASPTTRSTRRVRRGGIGVVLLLVLGLFSADLGSATIENRHHFSDVDPSAFYAAPITWASANGITTGVGGTGRFEPNRTVTRAEMVTMVWRDASRPVAVGVTSYGDVHNGHFAAPALSWAASEWIIDPNVRTISPEQPLTRREVVTLLWRAAGKPHADGVLPSDVGSGDSAAAAIRWAYNKGISTGVGGSSRFEPDRRVTRGEAVTFVWRARRVRNGEVLVPGPSAPAPAPRPTTPPPTTPAPTTPPPTTPAPTTPPPTTPPSTGVPGGIHVNEAAIPAPNPGWGNARINNASYSPIRQPSDPTGAFRVNCQVSHWNFDDPIVFPSVRRATHLHAFYGNTAVDGTSTATSVRTTGNSTCTGGTSNRTAYWAPAIIDTRTGNPVHPGTDAEARDHALQVYYKSGYDGVQGHMVQNFPDGLRMIAGTASSTSPQPSNIVNYHCANGPNGGTTTTSFPNCRPGQIFVMTVTFPQCWDGRNLDSPDHKSHMAYGAGWPDRGCPASHPVPLPQVTQNFRYRVPPTGMSTWRLASDMYSGPAGYSGHADWINGWDRNVFQRVIDNCIRPGLDCQMNLLGDGRALY